VSVSAGWDTVAQAVQCAKSGGLDAFHSVDHSPTSKAGPLGPAGRAAPHGRALRRGALGEMIAPKYRYRQDKIKIAGSREPFAARFQRAAPCHRARASGIRSSGLCLAVLAEAAVRGPLNLRAAKRSACDLPTCRCLSVRRTRPAKAQGEPPPHGCPHQRPTI